MIFFTCILHSWNFLAMIIALLSLSLWQCFYIGEIRNCVRKRNILVKNYKDVLFCSFELWICTMEMHHMIWLHTFVGYIFLFIYVFFHSFIFQSSLHYISLIKYLCGIVHTKMILIEKNNTHKFSSIYLFLRKYSYKWQSISLHWSEIY